MSAITSAEGRERLQRIWRSAAYGATAKDLLWLTQQTVRLLEERDRLKALSPQKAVSCQPSALSQSKTAVKTAVSIQHSAVSPKRRNGERPIRKAKEGK